MLQRRLGDGHRHVYNGGWDVPGAKCKRCGCTRSQAKFFSSYGVIPPNYMPHIPATNKPSSEEKTPDQLLDIAIEGIKTIRGKAVGGQGLNNFGWVNKEGRTNEIMERACYGWLSYNSARGAELFYDYGGWANTKQMFDFATKHIEYINYLLNYSAFTPCLVTRDPKFVLDHGWIADASFPTQMILSLGQSLRYMNEKQFVPANWKFLTDRGCNPDLALLLAHWGKPIGNNYSMNLSLSLGHTWARISDMGNMNIRKFCEHDYSSMKKFASMGSGAGYRGLCRIWGDGVGSATYYYSGGKEHIGLSSSKYIRAWKGTVVWDGAKVDGSLILAKDIPDLLDKFRKEDWYNGKTEGNDSRRGASVSGNVQHARLAHGYVIGSSGSRSIHGGRRRQPRFVWKKAPQFNEKRS